MALLYAHNDSKVSGTCTCILRNQFTGGIDTCTNDR